MNDCVRNECVQIKGRIDELIVCRMDHYLHKPSALVIWNVAELNI